MDFIRRSGSLRVRHTVLCNCAIRIVSPQEKETKFPSNYLSVHINSYRFVSTLIALFVVHKK